MPRQREFDPHQTLQTAIELFWEKGYYDSAVDELVRRSGVAKYGIYGVLGTKREIFLKALRQYALDRHGDSQQPIRKPDAALPEVTTFFRKTPKLVTKKRERPGCLICNTGIEMGARDKEIRDFVREFFLDLTRVLEACLERAIARKQMQAPDDLRALASFLATEFRAGLMLAASGVPRREIERHFETALQILH